VLGLHVTEAVKTLLVSIVEEAEGIPETKGSLGTDLCENLAFVGGFDSRITWPRIRCKKR
jgi:hypothetical protein